MELDAVALLCGLAAVVFAAGSARSRRAVLLSLGTFGLALAILLAAVPPAAPTIAAAVVAAAATVLVKPDWSLATPMAAGVLGALWVSALTTQGLPFPAAVVVVGGLMAAAVMLSARRRGFAPAALRDEALVLVAVLGCVVGTGDNVLAGWRAATAFTAEPMASGAPAASVWLLAMAAVAVLAGGLYTFWARR